ncbi:restriction endonuclease subunit S [Amycolatopsis sp. RM579]|uniref:Restriction endonuclease subunit S n=2 Tax=Amycolatopsis pithecellobii TaxID=664692 RepID=A0A6N7YQA1_9PSEU|nr:restriction endonuclease subunit S [Amycolatopsis pithecellobii]
MAQLDAEQAVARPLETRLFAEVSKGYTIFRDGDVLAAKITPCWENGKIGQARLDNKIGVGSTEFHVVRPGVELDERYLLHFLRQPAIRASGELRMTGSAGQRRVPAAFLRDLRVPVPSLDEQRRIAGILDQADAIRAKRRQVLAHLDALTQSIFRGMFAEAPVTTTVEHIAIRMRTGPFGSQLLHSEFVDDGAVAVLGLDNVVANEFRWAQRRYITDAKYEKLKRYTVLPGDVLISIMGTTGRCVVVPENITTAINTKHICAVTVDRENFDPIFLRGCFLWHPESRVHLHRQTKGSVMDGLNMGIIKEMPVPVPPLGSQREFAARAYQVEVQRALVRRALDADNELFASLQGRAFQGEL